MNIYELDERIAMLDAVAIDPDTGEFNEAVLAELEGYKLEREKKIVAVGNWYRNTLALADGIRERVKRQQQRIKSLENLAERLKSWLDYACGGEKFVTEEIEIKYRKSESLEFTDAFDMRTLPEEYLRRKDPEVNKVELKKAIKEGEIFDGVSLVEKQNIQIK